MAGGRPKVALILTDDERVQLDSLAHRSRTAPRCVSDAQVMPRALLSCQGESPQVLKAVVGSRRDTLRAGSHPANSPTSDQDGGGRDERHRVSSVDAEQQRADELRGPEAQGDANRGADQ